MERLDRRHRHRPTTETVWGFAGCVAPGGDCDPRSHGGVVLRRECACGATREVNVNQWWRESSPWEPARL